MIWAVRSMWYQQSYQLNFAHLSRTWLRFWCFTWGAINRCPHMNIWMKVAMMWIVLNQHPSIKPTVVKIHCVIICSKYILTKDGVIFSHSYCIKVSYSSRLFICMPYCCCVFRAALCLIVSPQTVKKPFITIFKTVLSSCRLEMCRYIENTSRPPFLWE